MSEEKLNVHTLLIMYWISQSGSIANIEAYIWNDKNKEQYSISYKSNRKYKRRMGVHGPLNISEVESGAMEE
jgi:hypothetical protein